MKKPEEWMRRPAEWIVSRLGVFGAGRGLTDEIGTLSGGKRGSVREYYVRKTERILLAALVMALICIPAAVLTRSRVNKVSDGRVGRPEYLSCDGEETLSVQAEGETEEKEMTFSVPARQYSVPKVRHFLKEASKDLDAVILGDNPSRDEVRTPLIFPETLQDGKVKISYMSMPYGMIGEDGSIVGHPSKSGSIVELQVTFTCQGEDMITEQAFCVYPPELSGTESFFSKVRDDVERAGKAGAEKAYMQLPQNVDGRKLNWYAKKDGYSQYFIVLMFLVPLFVHFQSDQKIREKVKERKEQLGLDYPELMWKMALLLGAGLSIRAVFSVIASDYRKTREVRPRYVGEEVLYTCHELETGANEWAAYEAFGRRCGRPEYIKLGGVLAQNMKKGSGGLAAMLEKEAAAAMENRRCSARKIGEQAGTKLLFPMILMFMVVIAILIVPAFMSM